MKSITLLELTERIEYVIHNNFSEALWVRAEISELRENRGYCYLELIEKEQGSDNVIAKTRATIWSNTYRMLKPYFESSTGEPLRAGLNVLVAVSVEFSGVYGFSLNIRDIDPIFTIGELAARRLEIIRQLEADGVMEMNKSLKIPPLPQRLAVITSATAAGYEDFLNQLQHNSYNYAFYPKLFPSIMQGANTENSIIRALEKIFTHSKFFDAVIIIRGGGATTDLAAFDSYNLALNCAQFPLPIIAGIGHQRDSSILDLVAHTSVKTPTAAAEFLIEQMLNTEENLNSVVARIENNVSETLSNEARKLEFLKLKIKQASRTSLMYETNHLNRYIYSLKSAYKKRVLEENNKLTILNTNINSHSPKFLHERGYTITTQNGKRLTSKKELKPGDKLQTHFADGSVGSRVESK